MRQPTRVLQLHIFIAFLRRVPSIRSRTLLVKQPARLGRPILVLSRSQTDVMLVATASRKHQWYQWRFWLAVATSIVYACGRLATNVERPANVYKRASVDELSALQYSNYSQRLQSFSASTIFSSRFREKRLSASPTWIFVWLYVSLQLSREPLEILRWNFL